MPQQTPIAKITRPMLADIYPRRRLLRLLDGGRNRSITWVAGPAGSGKTAIITSWIEGRKLPCLWYQIDEGDGDIATFFYYMGLAGKKAAPRVRRPLPLLTPEYLLDVPTFSKRYFENLFSRLRTPFVLVFDNYQMISASSPFHEILQTGLSSIPRGIHVVIISRAEPPPAFTRMLAENTLSVIGWDDLRLTPEESRRIALLHCKTPQYRHLFTWMHEKTDGWVAGLVLFIKALGRKAVEPQTLPSLPPEKIFEYFANELFEKIDEDTRDFLLKTSVLPKLTASLAEQLTGNRNADRTLCELSRNNYFTARRRLEADTYEYHTLFREFLLERARRSYSQAEFRGIQKQAAALLVKAAQIEDAAGLFIQSEDWEGLTSLVLTNAPNFLAQGRGQTVTDWIRRIPESICEQTPFLYYWHGISLMPYNPIESLPHLETAFRLFREKKDPAGTFLSFSGAVESITFGFHTYKQFDRWISILYKLRAEFRGFPSEEIEARVTMSMLIMLCLRQPQHPDYEVWLERAISLVQTVKDNFAKLYFYFAVVGYRLFSGELSKAALLTNTFREAVQIPGVTPLVLLTLRDLEAFHYWLTANFEECTKAATDGLVLASSKGVHLVSLFIAGHGAAGALSAGDVETAERFLREMESRLDQTASWGKGFYHVIATWKALLRKDLPQALLHAETGLELSLDAGMPQTTAICHLGMALSLHALKRGKEASAHIAEVHKISRTTNIRQVEFAGLLAEAQFELDRDDKDSARGFLRKAMALGREHGYVNVFFWLPSVMAGLCVEALEAGIEPAYVRNLVRKRNLIPDTPPLECENWPWPFKINTFGEFKLLRDDKPLEYSRKAPKKPLELLRVIVALGGRNLSEERLTDVLWPDAEGDSGRKSLSVTLARLRELLGVKDALQVHEGMVSLDDRLVWTDVWALERMLESSEFRVRSLEKKGIKDKSAIRNPKSEIDNLQKALNLYRGHFLEGESASWAISPRERLRESFVHTIEALGGHWERKREWQKALEVYRKGVQADDLMEKCYIRQMSCLLKLGSRAEALSVYLRLKKTLEGYGVSPSAATEELHRSILSNKPRPFETQT